MLDVGDEVQVDAAQAAKDRQYKQEVEALRDVASTYEGRETLWRIIGHCNVFGNSFRGEDSHLSAFEEGKRAVGLFIIQELFTSNKNSFTLLQSEAIKRAERIEREIENEQRTNAE